MESINIRKDEKEKIYALIESLVSLPLDKKSAFKAGEIDASLNKKGNKIDIEDVMIGAIAIINNEKLLTRNTKHFKRIKGLVVEEY